MDVLQYAPTIGRFITVVIGLWYSLIKKHT